jgi:uncharacterized protein (TIGR02246 family)
MLVAATLLAGCATAGRAPAAAMDVRGADEVRRGILTYTAAANRGDVDGVMSVFSRDVLLSYPGIPAQRYDDLAQGYREMMGNPAVKTQTEPTIEEISVSGDLAYARLVWNTAVTDTRTGQRTTRQMKDLQIWRREPDGRWRFVRGMHYREPPRTPAPAGQ